MKFLELIRHRKEVARGYESRFVSEAARQSSPGALVLDAGAGECIYAPLFSHCRYVAVDVAIGDPLWDYGRLDVLAPLDRLPFPDTCFDAAIATQVFEHLSHPRACALELWRVLKPGGKLYVTVPFFHPEHQVPYDFFRFSSFGLRSVLEEAGFPADEIRIEPFGGVFVRWAYELGFLFVIFPFLRLPPRARDWSLRDLARAPLSLPLRALVRTAQALLFLLNPLDRSGRAPLGWGASATKPAARPATAPPGASH